MTGTELAGHEAKTKAPVVAISDKAGRGSGRPSVGGDVILIGAQLGRQARARRQWLGDCGFGGVEDALVDRSLPQVVCMVVSYSNGSKRQHQVRTRDVVLQQRGVSFRVMNAFVRFSHRSAGYFSPISKGVGAFCRAGSVLLCLARRAGTYLRSEDAHSSTHSRRCGGCWLSGCGKEKRGRGSGCL